MRPASDGGQVLPSPGCPRPRGVGFIPAAGAGQGEPPCRSPPSRGARPPCPGCAAHPFFGAFAGPRVALVIAGRRGMLRPAAPHPCREPTPSLRPVVMRCPLPRRPGLAGVLALLLVVGCRGNNPALTPVRGKVSYQGMLLQSGTIVFTPDVARGTRGGLAYAEIQPDGTFSLKTGDQTGAVSGWHRVTIAAVRAPAQTPPGHRYA